MTDGLTGLGLAIALSAAFDRVAKAQTVGVPPSKPGSISLNTASAAEEHGLRALPKDRADEHPGRAIKSSATATSARLAHLAGDWTEAFAGRD
ncbi:hypothetical protein [Sagittula stellata]|uniref:Uncharacterized protein n=1 Tax=Sagittula stellata (strain ATCC 700073 / DSM 11524 / E-37) TaxID=388399 RepID=A3K840_SAGS3|nr:hypothetical protein [Sagittula stellata]EBA06812.1 hypothetical protein SSE37_02955 [Sagittula stellata E-37]